jgi:UDP-GlcNAc:undecaprenyl-phosphate GlcNAc-1-phosphate transferase
LNPAIVPRIKSLSIPLLLLAMPILDTTVAVTSRIYRGLSPFEGGRDHLSHRLMRIGVPRNKAAVTLWALAGVFGVLAVVIYKWPHSFGYPVMAFSAFSLIALLVFFLRIPSADPAVTKG